MGTQLALQAFSINLLILVYITCCHGEANSRTDSASKLPAHLPLVSMPNPRITESPQDVYCAKDNPITLDCAAEGDPKPTITWYHNRRKVNFSSENYNENLRTMLPDGQLFFLQMIHTKDKTYSGKYYCEATNERGTARSLEATIKIAVIKDDFRDEPDDTTKSLGSRATLHCKPPRGEPEPRISWLHNGIQVSFDGRVEINDGDLVINSVMKADAGEYVCQAQNVAGEKKSSPVILSVLERPVIDKYPNDMTADEGESVEFTCSASGDGNVIMSWRKEGGNTNQRKWRILDNHTLRITNIASSDVGTYVCTAENAAGVVEAVAHLNMEYLPKIVQRPLDQSVAIGRTVSMQCSAVGNPEPTIYWETKSVDILMFENNLYANGRMSVAEDGTLRIERVQESDEGEYTCKAISSLGKAEDLAILTVITDGAIIFPENDLRPPPVIRFGPTNQTLSPDSVALLRCQATGNPEPVVRWYKNDQILQMEDARYTQLDSGTLQISSLKVSDSGKYACKAGSETGETTVQARLIVDSHISRSDTLTTPPDLTKFPAAPEKPVVSDVTDTSVRLTWELLRIVGNTPITGYQVEYFAYGSQQTWQIAGYQYTDTDIIIGGLEPDTTYVFLVRARNEYGIGGPSPLSDLIRTLEKGEGLSVAPTVNLPMKEIEARLQKVEVKIRQVKAINSSALRLSWMVDNEYGVVTGFKILYKLIVNMGDPTNLRYGAIMTKHVRYRPLAYTITGLESYEFYEVCVMATSGDKLSPCSQPMRMQSGESVPSSPPLNVNVQRESDSEVLVTWSPPDVVNRKGEITGYQVRCFSVDKQHNCSSHTNSTTRSVKIDNLVPGVNYNIEVAAQTKKGVGKWSDAFSIGPSESGITKEPWFIGMIGAIGGILWLGLCIFTVWLCKSRKRRKKLKEQWYTGGQAPSEKQQERNGSVARKGYGKKDGNFQDGTDQCLPAEFSTLLQQTQHEGDENMDPMCSHHPEMKTFYSQSGPVTPYATTALLQAQAQSQRKAGCQGDQMFRPIMQHSGGSGDSNTDRSNTTDVSIELRECNRSSAGDSGHLSDENGFLIKQNRKPGYRPVVSQNQAVVNWSDVLPPPPNHPPSDHECLQDDQLYSEIPEDRARSPKSPTSIAQMSACSCPVPHTQPTPTYNPSSYSDNCNRCQSLRNFDNRPYSPQQLMQLHRQQGFPPNVAQSLAAHPNMMNNPRGGGTPVYMHGYSQPWDCQPLPRGAYEYDYAQVPRDEGYNYTQPIQDALIQHSNTLNARERSIQGPRGQINDMGEPQGQYPGHQCHPMNIPGGPPGNYCEGPCRSQVETLNSINNSYHRNMGDNSNTQLPYLEGYKIDSPPSSASGNEYRVCNSGGSHTGSGASHAGSGGDSGRSNSGFKGRSSSEGNDLKERQFQVGHPPKCRPVLYHSRSENSPPGHCMIDEGYTRNADSPISEDHEDYIEEENEEEHHSQRDSMVANWESMEDCSDAHSSTDNNEADDADGQFLNEEDFASAVARAAELSGLTVVGTTISDPTPKQAKKVRRHHRPVRPPSPGYSTDSNYGTADIPHKPYPKSQRRKQMADHGKHRKRGDNISGLAKGDNLLYNDTIPPPDVSDITNGADAARCPVTHHPSTSPVPLSSPPIPSLYRNKSSEGASVHTSSANKLPMFKLDDIPVV